jgi:tetratricopeptide (TPR) repeat protein
MPVYRKTAIVQLELPSGAMESSLPLTCEREFGVILSIAGKTYPAQSFRSPINDEQWREFVRQLRACNVNHDEKTGYRGATAIRALARTLYQSLAQLSPALREFLDSAGVPRRLVIQTTRPELHLLPWAALYDESGNLLAAGDLSVVQAWSDFNQLPLSTGSRLQLLKVLGSDTNQRTAAALQALQRTPEIVQRDAAVEFAAGRQVSAVDILHIEEHGNAVLSETGDVPATTMGETFRQAKIALLWSCYSGAADSWGVSPALCLHRNGVGMVLSFLAELHYDDAGSIAEGFYADVFGAAASRDPESALLRIRCAKVATEFAFANWASMTVYLRSPLDLTALPLNGPRVPAAGWLPAADEAKDTFWTTVANQVSRLQSGAQDEMDASAVAYTKLPTAVFKLWRGNVIRIDESAGLLADDATLRELGLATDNAPATDAADRLVWFFTQITRFGSPLIVWSNAAKRHVEFVQTIQPSASLTFLFLHGPKSDQPSLIELVEENQLQRALAACPGISDGCGDESLHAAYYACVRGEQPELAKLYISRIKSLQERLLLMGNFVERYPAIPLGDSLLASMGPGEVPRRPQDFYRLARHAQPPEGSSLRETGRAKHEIAYLMHYRGQKETAEMLYTLALADLEASTERDSRWYFALASVLRDWADLLSADPDRLEEALRLLRRATAIQAFHGLRLELAYSTATAARIALASERYTKAIDHAVDAANRFVQCDNWRGWSGALHILFDSLAETRETERMLSLANMAKEKLQFSNLPDDQREVQRQALAFQRARAHWIAGELAEARAELESIHEAAAKKQEKPDAQVDRLYEFLRLSPEATS